MNDPDLLVVGGGINGTAIARDAAGRGLRVLLVEQDDLASATSSASTKLIHGGLRYLEYYDLRLVRESLRERETMLRTAPHLIRPLRFVLPYTPGVRPRWIVRAGLLLYDILSIGGSLPWSRATRIADPSLRPGITSGFAYWDAWVDDARLVVLNAIDARERGAEIRTRTRLHAAGRKDGRWRAEIEDVASGEVAVVRPRAIVNAAGPWVEEVLRGRLSASGEDRVRLVKGSHIVVPRLSGSEDAFLLQQPDRRIVFAIPYEGHFTLIGTTEVTWDAPPGPARISDEEVTYLCAAANRFFATTLTSEDVVASFSGVRALHDDGRRSASAVTRDYQLALDAKGAPLLSVFGGKITTARALAEEAVDMIAGAGLPAGKPWTRHAPLPGGGIRRFEAAFTAAFRRWPAIDPATLRRLLHAYGDRLSQWIGDGRDLGEDFGAGLSRAEVDHLVASEWARTADDILWRRTKIGLHIDAAGATRLAAYLEGAA